MKDITRLMINEYKLKDIDFMGYKFTRKNASYHHLITPKRFGGEETIENGAVLNGNTSHPYLHLIECFDYDIFEAITDEMIIENQRGRLDEYCIRRIHSLLREFEENNKDLKSSKGKSLIKYQYLRR